MKIIGALSWFNESPLWLTKTIASFARVCDQVVAVDGRYALFDHDFDWSPAAEPDAVVAAAEAVGLPLTLHVPREPFAGNEVEKRNLLMRLAMVHAEPMEDWIFVLDADEYIVHVDPTFRDELAATEEHIVGHALEEYLDPYVALGQDGGVARFTTLPTTWRVDLRGFYRALPGLSYVGTHFTIGGYVDGEWVWLWGHPDKVPQRDLREMLIVRHENPRRVALRRELAAGYYAARDELGIESPDVLAPT